jgi:hypothetical protein
MATGEHPAIIGLAIDGWRYALAMLSRMPGLLGVATLFMFALNIVTLPLLPAPQDEPTLGMQIVSFLTNIVSGFLLTPVAIATHRFVLLGEISRHYALNPSESRFMRFFTFTVVYQLLMSVPGTLMSLAGKSGTGLGLALALVFFALFIVAVIASVRLLILFPAIAVDAPGADWRNAMADTKGHSWRVFFIMILATLPSLMVVMPLYFTLAWPDGPGLVSGIFLSAAQAAVSVLTICALAAVASKLFAAFANRLNG